MNPRRDLASRHPLLYHVAETDALAGIERHALLSTTALLDLFGYQGVERTAIEANWRPDSKTISHPIHGTAVIRDQKPMRPTSLAGCLDDGLTPSDWYRLLNRKAFLWPTAERVTTLLAAAAYRDRPHLVLAVDTASLLADGKHEVTVSRINSGSAFRKPARRGLATFVSATSDALPTRIAEVAVDYAIRDVMSHVVSIDRRVA